MRTLVYVSGPTYQHTGGPWEGVRAGLVAGDLLFDAGYAPIVPHLSFYWKQEHNANRTFEEFEAVNLALIPQVDCLLRIEGDSRSADEEVRQAQRYDVPVFYELADLLAAMPACPVAEQGFATGGVVGSKLYLVGETLDAFNPLCTPPSLQSELDSLRSPPVDVCVPMTVTTWDDPDDLGPKWNAYTSEEREPSPIDRALTTIGAIFASKNADYADQSERWDSNFSDVARQMAWDSPREAAEVLIAVKQARLRALRTNDRQPANEAVGDTILDRAVYSVIALAMLFEEEG